MYKLALIILNYYSETDTTACVDQLLSLALPCPIVIVDNASPDGSGERLAARWHGREGVCVIRQRENRGYSAGNNTGLRFAADELGAAAAAIINPDVIIPDRDVLASMYRVLTADEGCAAVGAVIANSRRMSESAWDLPAAGGVAAYHCLPLRRRVRKLTTASETEMVDGIRTAEVGCLAGCFVMLRLDFLKRIGYLDEHLFLYGEETLLGLCCRREGFRERLVLDCTYCHNHHRDAGSRAGFLANNRRSGHAFRSRRYILKTCFGGRGLVRLVLAEGVNRLWILAVFFKNVLLRRP